MKGENLYLSMLRQTGNLSESVAQRKGDVHSEIEANAIYLGGPRSCERVETSCSIVSFISFEAPPGQCEPSKLHMIRTD